MKALTAALAAVIALPMLIVVLTTMSASPQPCPAQPVSQPGAAARARNSIPASYLALYQKTGTQYGIPWQVLAGIGEAESDHGRSKLPGVHSGQNGFGAAGPMQIGIGGGAGNVWGGPPVHPASQNFGGVAADGDGDGIDNVYDPADAIAGAAKYLAAHGAPGDLPAAIFAYNHLRSYVQNVLSWASRYSNGGFTVSTGSPSGGASCAEAVSAAAPGQVVAAAISYAERQIGKPYLWGGTGPAAFDCSGLVMMAYRAGGITIPRTSQDQWAWGPRVQPGHEEPGDLVFFAGSDGTPASPGHVGLVLRKGIMIDALESGVPVQAQPYTAAGTPVGFTRPGAHSGAAAPAGQS